MLEDICRELNNWFDEDPKNGTPMRYFGTFAIVDGTIGLSETGIKEGQYFRIVGSVNNDGVYQYPASELMDEVFDGAVWLMLVPKAVISLDTEIEAWKAKYGSVDSAAMSPFTSESFGGYSYSKSSRSSSSGVDASSGTWQGVFASQLNKYRKIRAI